MKLTDAYFKKIQSLQEEVMEQNREQIAYLGKVIGNSLSDGGILHVFGSGHSGIVAREIVHRAGGLVPVSMIHDPTSGWAETVEGYGTKLLSRYGYQYGLKEGETAVIVSNSGRNPSPVEIALGCRKAGLHTVGITSLKMARQTTPVHSGGKLLYEVVDTVLDNGVEPGDASLELEGQSLKTGPTSTFTGALLMQAMVLSAIEWLRDEGHSLPILQSANTTGGREYNEKLADSYKHRLCRPL